MKHDITIWNLSQYLDADFTLAQNHQLKTQFRLLSGDRDTKTRHATFNNGIE